MRIIKNAYLHLGGHVKTKVLNPDNSPAFPHIDLWNGQTEHVGDDGSNDNEPFDLPALFIEFDADKIGSIGLYQVEAETNITFYVAFESMNDTNFESSEKEDALHFLELCSLLHEQLQGYTAVGIGSLEIVSFRRYKTRSNLIVYMISYKTTLRDTSAYDKRRDTVTNEVDLNTVIPKRPHKKPGTEGSGEQWFDLSK